MLDANIAAKQEEIATTEEFFEARDALLDAYENALKGFLTDVDETSFAIFNIRSLQQRHEGEAETLTEGIENKETNIRDLHEQRVELESEKDRKIAAIGSLAWQIEEQSPVESEPSATESPPPTTVVPAQAARARAIAKVPAANGAFSNRPIGPFQNTVLAA